MHFFTKKLRKPVFIKTTSSLQRQLEQMQAIDRSSLADSSISLLEHDINLVTQGLEGESRVEFQLRNSHMPMYVLRDLNLEYDGLSAQIDFLVIMRKCNFVIECKNHHGNIEIDEKGTFIQTTKYESKGIDSPVTQNERHLDLIKQICMYVGKPPSKAIFEKLFPGFWRSVIVFANPETILFDKSAPKYIKSQVIRADALIKHLRKANKRVKQFEALGLSDKELEALASFFLDAHVEREIDYAEKYRKELINADTCPKCGGEMFLQTRRKPPPVALFWGCKAYPDCNGSRSYEETIT